MVSTPEFDHRTSAVPVDWTPTRAAGLARLADFLPRAGSVYARDRNQDRGPEDRSNVSALSPWIRRRLVTDEEVLRAVLQRHDHVAAEKFIQEVFWRGYWKGWLEMRPAMLVHFDRDRRVLAGQWRGDPRLAAAMEGRTGIGCFDAWASELTGSGWLHNHARMWFASIWIFTLRLPWQLGADFFYKHLLDADPASNTLSWRWVAGLHTPGKHYLARAANVHLHTQGRFNPAGQLDETAAPLTEDEAPPMASPAPQGDRPATPRVGLLLTEEDLHPESWVIAADVLGCAALESPVTGTDDRPAARFGRGALEDGLARAEAAFAPTGGVRDRAGIVHWAKGLGVTEIVTGYAPAGLIAWSLDGLYEDLKREGIRLVRLQRAFDARVWPHAKAGFFKLKERIPGLIAGLA
jgi:deoxyribodipyrimidine photo-lyase